MLFKFDIKSGLNKDPRVALTTEGVTDCKGVDMTYLSAFQPSSLYSHKENYFRYLDSRQWDDRKRAYWNSDRYKRCWACDAPWSYGAKGFNFHHTSYENLFNEPLEDLVLFCSEHHQEFEKQIKEKSSKTFNLEMQTYLFICHKRIDLGLKIAPVIKFMKGLID